MAHGHDEVEKKGGLLSLFRGKKEDEEPINPKAPIAIHTVNAPEYNQSAVGPLFPSRIKYNGLYDLDGLYKLMANWMRQRRFELHETLYKARPPELEIRWRAERRKTGFAMEVIEIYYHSWGDYDVEVVKNGKKKKMTNARMILTISGDLLAPYSDIFGRPRWTANGVERRLLNIFRNWFMKRELESLYWDTFYYEVWKLHGAIKDFMGFEAKGNVY